MRTTVTLDEDIYEAAVCLSQLSGERLGKVLSRMARCGLQQKNTPRRRGRRRFPTFDISSGAPVIPACRIKRVMDNEDVF
jgi:hypothetical protein